jgi:hypothetical protein
MMNMKKTIILIIICLLLSNLIGYSSVLSDQPMRGYPIGTTIWEYTISTSWDNSPKAIASIPDIDDDGIDDVIVCSEDDYVRCFDGSAIGTGIILWEHEITGGDIYSQKGLTITEDVDSDGYNDVVVGSCGGSRSIITLSGKNGSTIWIHDTHEYGDGGWVYMVDAELDFNNDGTRDVLATTGDDSSDTGPKRVYCLNGLTGVSIWECPLGGPGFSVIGVEDFTGDGEPDVIAGASDEYETTGYVYGINGVSGIKSWTFTTGGSSVWALEHVDDMTGDSIDDVIAGDFAGNIYGLDATNGNQEYYNSVGSYVIIVRFEKINDVNSDGHPDIIPAHLGGSGNVMMIDGYTGSTIWTHTVIDKPAVAARIDDVSGDGINDVLIGTLFGDNYVYFLNGVNGSEIWSTNYYEALDAIAAITDVAGDGSMEMVAGGRNGKVRVISGGILTQQTMPTVETVAATNISAISATLNGNLTDLGNASSCQVRFVWDTVSHTSWENYSFNSSNQTLTATGSFDQDITSLNPNVTYHFRAVATNTVGTVQGDDLLFQTLLQAPVVVTDPATNITETTAQLNGNLVDMGGASSCEVWFVWDTVEYLNWSDYTFTTTSKVLSTPGSFDQIITNLDANVTYHFRAVASNIAQTSQGDDQSIEREIFVINLSNNWNFISIPCNSTLDMDDLLIQYNGSLLNWSSATSINNPSGSALIDNNVFGWNRVGQFYSIETTTNGGFGYWLFCYENCELWMPAVPTQFDDFITSVEPNWNIIGNPSDQPTEKTSVLVNNTIWNDAVIAGLIDDSVFSWDAGSQMYGPTTSFNPGEGYWLFGYQPCILERTL